MMTLPLPDCQSDDADAMADCDLADFFVAVRLESAFTLRGAARAALKKEKP
jgi:hypothetical protein